MYGSKIIFEHRITSFVAVAVARLESWEEHCPFLALFFNYFGSDVSVRAYVRGGGGGESQGNPTENAIF